MCSDGNSFQNTILVWKHFNFKIQKQSSSLQKKLDICQNRSYLLPPSLIFYFDKTQPNSGILCLIYHKKLLFKALFFALFFYLQNFDK